MFTSVKVFSATKAKDRNSLGERITEWIRLRQPRIVNKKVRQSSDREFHCLTIVLFYNEGT
jgi:hypothetical protein